MEFGFLLNNKRFEIEGIEIKPRHDHDEIVMRFYETVSVCKGWIYPPLKTINVTDFESKKFKKKSLQVTSNFFRVSPTHSIILNPYSAEKAKFLILSYGFLHGLYLSPVDHLYLNKIPYEEGKLTRIVLCGNDYQKGIQAFNVFYDNSTPDERKQMFALLHWFLIGQTYEFAWDRFDAQYKVLDGLYKISGIKSQSHTSRPIDMANKYGITLPNWAKIVPNNPKKSRLSIIRNELVHEAKYAGHPIGYAYPSENIDYELVAFNIKLIASIVGLKTPYLHTAPNDRQMHGWDFV